ncbi:MAG: hypothetical protein JNM90_05475 [Burkholderiales bacterium]|nr:hypothetical protein [Burkholderiales bacterium]
MKTVVLQSFRTRDVPRWMDACMQSVRAWAAAQGWAYEFMDDDFFGLAPDWTRWRCKDNHYAVTDICRLVWATRALDAGYERAVWADADVLVFDPAALRLEPGRGHGFARELFLHVAPDGVTTPHHGLSNALMAFERGDDALPTYLELCYAVLRGLPPGPVPRTALGPKLLNALAAKRPLAVIERVGLFSQAILEQVAAGGGALTREYLARSPTRPAAANLCHFLRNLTPPPRRAVFDAQYDAAVARLLESAGAVLGPAGPA